MRLEGIEPSMSRETRTMIGIESSHQSSYSCHEMVIFMEQQKMMHSIVL